MSDNVTPFRRPPKRPVAPQQQGGWGFKTHRGRAVLVQALTLIAFVLNFVGSVAGQFLLAATGAAQLRGVIWIIGLGVGIAAVVIAFSNRNQAMPWANTHHEHALRTLVIGYAIWTLGSLLTYVHGSLIVGTMFVQIGVAVWAVLRAVIGLALSSGRKPIPHPRGAFI